MIIDAHTHIFPPAIRNQRERFFPGEGAFELLYRSPKSRLVGAAELVETMDQARVQMSVVFGFPWASLETSRRNNDYVIEAVQRYPHRLAGLCCLDTCGDGAVAEVARCLDSGLAGVGELAFYQCGIEACHLCDLGPIMELCRIRQVPVMIHTNEPVGHSYPGKSPNTLKQIYDLIRSFPDNTLILAHWGGGILFYNLLKKETKDAFKNVYFDTAASPYLYDPAIYAVAAQSVGSDKILFGSDYPLLPPQRYFKEIKASGLSPEDRAAICGNNAARVFSLL